MNLHLTRNDLEKIDIVKAILEKEYRNHYTHQQLAQKVNTNESKLRYGFKLATTKTMNEYQTMVRIEKAKELLIMTDLPVKRIAAKVGYDKSNLNKQFKRLTHVSPLEWRKNNRNNFNSDAYNTWIPL